MQARTKAERRSQRTGQSVRRFVAFGLAAATIATACTSGDDTAPSTPTTTTTAPTTTTATTGTAGTTGSNGSGSGVRPVGASSIRLSAGESTAEAAEPIAVVDGTPLDEAAFQAVIDRLPEFLTDDGLATTFNWPTETRPAPRAGTTLDVAFPSPDDSDDTDPPPVTTGALHVLRHQPDGEVEIAPFVTITFDQPMVPVATVTQLAAADVPATITPAISGAWQWIGTKTLRFDASSDDLDRLPMATEYTVEIPVGTTSATGGVLADAVSFQFATPPVTVRSFSPVGDSLPLTPVFVTAFDQRIDPQAVLDTVTVTADDVEQPLRLATAAEIEADESARAITAAAPDARVLVFRAVDPLPADASIDVEIGPGTPSAEGSLTTTAADEYDGRTYAPLAVESAACGYESDCPPGSGISIDFNNPIDTTTFDPSSITVEPAIPGMVVGASGSSIFISGATAGRTTYTVTVPAGLADVFGQHLAETAQESIEFGAARPILQPFNRPLTTLDPYAANPSVDIFSINHDQLRVRTFAVESKDWPAFIRYATDSMQSGRPDDPIPDPPFALIEGRTIDIADEPDRMVETTVDLSAAIGEGHGHVVVLVEPTERDDSDDQWLNRPTVTWAQATDIGLDATSDGRDLHAWTTDLSTGTPMAGVGLELVDNAGQGVGASALLTDERGLATLALAPTPSSMLVATNGDDTAILPGDDYGGGWWQNTPTDHARWFVFDDRQTYQPEETVSIKGWVRRFTAATDGQLQLLGDGADVAYSATDAQGNVIATGSADVNPLGGFDFTFVVPADANLGPANVGLALTGVAGMPDAGWGHGFQIQEFRRPEFEVAARPESQGPFVQGSPLTVAVDADYYAGGPLAAAPVDWQVTTSSATYSPPGWDDFGFGVWTPWWYAADYGSYVSDGGGVTSDVDCCFPPGIDAEVATFSGTTDADGANYLQIDVGDLDEQFVGLPITVSSQATVTDVNRQAWASTTNALVHPADLYVGLRSDSTFVDQGDPLVVDAIVTDIDGTAVAGSDLTVVATRSETSFTNGEYVTTDVDPQGCSVTSAIEGVSCTFTTEVGGTYTIRTEVTDADGLSSRTELTRWVSGGDTIPARNVEQQDLTVVPDRAEYAPGDTASLLVQSPIATGTGLVTVSRGNLVSTTTTFAVTDGSAVVSVPIDEGDIPGLDITLEVVGATPRESDDGTIAADAVLRPAFAVGQLRLPISLASRTLTVTATPLATTVEPGAATQVDVNVSNADGTPVSGSELAVVVVDEAVLALSGATLDDPLAAFYGALPGYLSTRYGRSSIVLADPATVGGGVDQSTESTMAETSADTTGGASGDAVPAAAPAADADYSSRADDTTGPVAVRTDFDALAVFVPSATTDADGNATIEVPLPDNLTRYRVMVVAVADADRFGSAEANITARLPLMARPSAPRFLNFGDTVELPVVVQNQTDAAMDVDVVLQADNLAITGVAGQRVTVPANDRVEARFPVAADEAGTARFRVAAVSGEAADATTVELPVYTPATAEAFATYGVLDGAGAGGGAAIVQPVQAPADVIPQFGGLDITTSSTSLQALTDAVLAVTEYEYRSSDAMAARIIAISSLRDVLDAFDAPGLPSPAALDAAIDDDIAGLVALQNGDGGFPYWRAGDRTDPFNSVQAVHALVIARAEGFSVPQFNLDIGLAYLAGIDQFIPSSYGQEAKDSIRAYALFVRDLSGDRDAAGAEALVAERGGELPLDAIAWLWSVVDDPRVSDSLETEIVNRSVDTAGAVTFTTAVSDDDYVTLRSDRRTDGLVLDALIRQRPDSDLIPKVVAGLLAGQRQGRWDNIQENSFILLAMRHYFDAFEAATPDFVAGVWLGDRFAGEHAFVGRSTDRARVSIPTADVIAAGGGNLTIGNDGTGRLYYRIGLRTAPADLQLQPLDRGFVVTRTYEAVDDPADVAQDADGVWHIRAGATVRVRLTMVAESRRTHVALIDPLAAGLEILNPSLATTPDIPADPTIEDPSVVGGDLYRYWSPTWFDHQNIRDDRAEAFSTWLEAGVYDYTYVARATTPGSFVVPPVRAEEMYAPETFGRGGTDRVVVEA